VKVSLRPSNAKRLYIDEKSTGKKEIIEEENRKGKRSRAVTLFDLYPSTCLPHACWHLFVVGGLSTSMTRIA